MRNEMIDAIRMNCEGNLQTHKTNIELYLNKSIGIGEHSDIIQTVIKELEQVAKYEELIQTLNKHFSKETTHELYENK
jgi:microsomal dipeptidase-like Zn-dependent dipeptidase|tara:strand:- start:1057 stop:1290 length:234 start_codon:yes stop_codon:yes gene_type:complete